MLKKMKSGAKSAGTAAGKTAAYQKAKSSKKFPHVEEVAQWVVVRCMGILLIVLNARFSTAFVIS